MKYLLGIILSICLSFNTNSAEFALGYDQTLLENEELRTAFLAYGISLVNWNKENPRSKPPYKFDREYSARKSMIKIWEELRNNGKVPESLYLSDLLQVYKDGYLKEYVWYFHKKEKWKKPRKLKIDKFEIYRTKNMVNHIPNPINLVYVTKG